MPTMNNYVWGVIAIVLAGIVFARERFALKRQIALLERKVEFLLKNHAPRYDPILEATPEMLRLVQSGRKIEAIQLYRQLRPVGLKEAKEAVEKLSP